MALVAASPPPHSTDGITADMSDVLDDEINQVRAEIQALSSRRKLLRSSLLSSTKVQDRLLAQETNADGSNDIPDDLPLLLESSKQHSQSNAHRLAFGVTSFPFTDPSPECQAINPLLGIRFDVCDRNGSYTKPYYIFCRRVSDSTQELRIHRHTVPALVPLTKYEREYLPLTDEGYGGSDDSALSNDGHPRRQNLHALVGRVRLDIVSWRLRLDAIELLCKDLEVSKPSPQVGNSSEEDEADNASDPDAEAADGEPEPCGKFGVRRIDLGSSDGYLLRILWSDDRVGRIKIAEDGRILKAAVIGTDRLWEQEKILTSPPATLYDFVLRLEKLHKTLQRGHRQS